MTRSVLEIFSADNLLLCSVSLRGFDTRSIANGGVEIDFGGGNAFIDYTGIANTYRLFVPYILDFVGVIGRGLRMDNVNFEKGRLLEIHSARVSLGKRSANLFYSNTFVQTREESS